MKFILKVTAITKIADARILVQLQGQYGNAQLDLPNNHQQVLHVGQDFGLSADTERFQGMIEESPWLGPAPPENAPELLKQSLRRK